MFGMGHVRANYSLGLVESDLGRIVVRLRAYKVLLVSHVRLDWILFVFCLGFLLRTARRRPISSTLPILLGLRGYVNKELNSLGLVSIPVGMPSLDRALIGVWVGELLSATWIESTTCKYL